MAKYLSIIIGAVAALLGIILLGAWRNDFITVIRGTIPVFLIFSGVIAAIAGISEMKDELASRKDEKK
ncbi:MAG: hypothetical protein ABIJ27_05670 [Candidatus Omnitrophota bacterium]